MSEEIWKDIDGFEGKYQVSTAGRVRSLDRLRGGGRHLVGVDIKFKLEKNGYLRGALSDGGVHRCFSVHRFVAEAFIPNPMSLPVVNHKDGVKTNNLVENLEWTTHSGNSNHAVEIGLFDHISGEMSHLCVHDESTILKVVEILKAGNGPSKTSRLTGVSRPVCSKINLGKMWKPFLKKVGVTKFPVCPTVQTNQFDDKFTKEQLLEIKALLDLKVPQAEIGRRFNSSQPAISRIKKGSKWKR